VGEGETRRGGVRLRPVGAGDEEFLFRVYAGTRIEELAVTNWSEPQREAFLRQQFSAQQRYYREHYAGATFDVIERDGQPIGRLYVARWPDEIRIVDIALLPEHRRRGIGSALVKEVLAEGDAAGKPVSIHVEQFNPAMRMYERLGFERVGEVGVYWLMRRAVGTGAGD
jgi:ribosomal protein S18 acetylase RimI-like enzyme